MNAAEMNEHYAVRCPQCGGPMRPDERTCGCITRQEAETMAFKLTKAEHATLDEHRKKLAELKGKIEDQLGIANEKIKDALVDVNDAVDNFNEALEAAKAFVTDIAEGWRGDWDDKSERWQEGDAGQAADQFIQQWQDWDPDQVSHVDALDLEADGDELSCVEDLEQLPEEAE